MASQRAAEHIEKFKPCGNVVLALLEKSSFELGKSLRYCELSWRSDDSTQLEGIRKYIQPTARFG